MRVRGPERLLVEELRELEQRRCERREALTAESLLNSREGEHTRRRPWCATGQVYCARCMYIRLGQSYMRSRRLRAPRAPPPPERRREASPRAPLPGSAAAPLPDVSSALSACRSRPATVRAQRGRWCEATKSPGGNTLASSRFMEVRRRQPHTSLPSSVHSLNAANPCALCLALRGGASPLTDRHVLTHARSRFRRLRYDRQRGRGRRDGRRRLLIRRAGIVRSAHIAQKNAVLAGGV